MDCILPSGAKLHITVSTFVDSHALVKAIMKSVKGLNLPQNLNDTEMSIAGAMGNPQLMATIVDKILSVAVSDEVEVALFKCMERATYEEVKITRSIFDDLKLGEQAREDYFSICSKVIEANCKPFFKKTFSALSGLTQAPTESPK